MKNDRKITKLAGALYFLGIGTGLLSVVSVIEEPNFLAEISANSRQIVLGAFFQFMMIIAYMGMTIVLFSILRKFNESLALGYICFRMVAAAVGMIGVVLLLLLLTISQEFVTSGTPASPHFHTIGEILRAGRDFVNHIGTILPLSMAAFY